MEGILVGSVVQEKVSMSRPRLVTNSKNNLHSGINQQVSDMKSSKLTVYFAHDF